MKILSETTVWTSKTMLNFGSYPDLDPDVGIFGRNFYHYDTGA